MQQLRFCLRVYAIYYFCIAFSRTLWSTSVQLISFLYNETDLYILFEMLAFPPLFKTYIFTTAAHLQNETGATYF